MTTDDRTRPWTVAGYLTRQIELSEKSQVQIAREAGFKSANVITMLKLGHTKVPLDRVPALADALGVSRPYLLELVLREYEPRIATVIEQIAGMMLSDNERSIILYIRKITGGRDPGIGGEEMKAKLRDVFSGIGRR